MRVLVACEFSGIVWDAFIAAGHDAVSCDLLPTERPGPHMQGDVLSLLDGGDFDLMVAHPPCTYLTVSGNKWMGEKYRDRFPDRAQQREDAIAFVRALYDCPIPCVAIENPIGVLSSRWRKPDQVIQPFHFGHPERKATCLWLKGLEPLRHTDVVPLPEKASEAQRVHWLPPSPNRWKLRSITYQGIANAMADQWGAYVAEQTRKAA